jgi:hypothetical protein
MHHKAGAAAVEAANPTNLATATDHNKHHTCLHNMAYNPSPMAERHHTNQLQHPTCSEDPRQHRMHRHIRPSDHHPNNDRPWRRPDLANTRHPRCPATHPERSSPILPMENATTI